MKISHLPNNDNCKIAIIGMGYVGLPLAIKFANSRISEKTGSLLNRKIIGYDLNTKRLKQLEENFDKTNEVSEEELRQSDILFTSEESKLEDVDVFIVTVPTPIDEAKKPDLSFLKNASITIGKSLKNRIAKSNGKYSPIIIYESTVYPGATEEICVPLIEKYSGLIYNNREFKKGFFCGYSPERINPGDKINNINNIVKVTSGSDEESSRWIDDLYSSVIKAGTFQAKSIVVAEAAKVIENTQRDINIALINELTIIFRKLNISTKDVLETAETKWNFLKFYPGFVGGHCIGVDPYYLTYKAQLSGYHPQIITAGRRINDGMAEWMSSECILEMAKRGILIANSRILIMGFTFKDNCPDIRNTKIINLVENLKNYGARVEVFDPVADEEELQKEYSLNLIKTFPLAKSYSVIIGAVSHKEFKNYTLEKYNSVLKENGFCIDFKNFMPEGENIILI